MDEEEVEMDCRECKTYIDAWIDRHCGSEPGKDHIEPFCDEVLIHTGQCPRCATHLGFAQLLIDPSSHTISIDTDVGTQVSQSVLARIAGEPKPSSKMRMGRALLAASVLTIMVCALLGEQAIRLVAPPYGREQVRLSIIAPDADSVMVAGDWNNWDSESQRLAKTGRGDEWSIELELESGKEYRYQFVIDGERWINDPSARMQVEDGFGGVNSILEM